jgi:diguanylate cyclase (GGDEF)-like protein
MAVAAMLVIHSAFVLMRVPMILMDQPSQGAFSGAWFGIAALESAIFIQIIAFLMVSMIKERVESQLRSVALTDPLTGLGNRRAFFEASMAVVAQNARHGRPTATIVFDLDRFKEINDRFGHPVGDAVIRTFADTATKRLRAGDIVGRLGGEEFGVTLSDTTGAAARLVAEQLNEGFVKAVAAMARTGLSCSASAGVAESPKTTCSLEDLLTSADRALYEAKALGGGQVCPGKPMQRFQVRAA